MNTCPDFDFLLVLPRLRVQNANAISSPLTHGFPSVTAFLGLMWALERKAREHGLDLGFKAVGAVCHDHQEQIAQEGFVGSFRLTRNPVDKDGSTAAIVEEGRIHLELSLVLAVQCSRWLREPEARTAEVTAIARILSGMRLAGGSFLPPEHPGRRRYQPYVIDLSGNEDDRKAQFRMARMRLLPGFTLVERDDLLDTRLAELNADGGNVSRLDAWLSLARINWRYAAASDGDSGKGAWQHDRTDLGWIVPVPVGYGALGDTHEPGTVANARDTTTPFRFVESLYSVGQWLSPHRLDRPQQLLWYADSQPGDGLYRCRNDYRATVALSDLHFDFD